MWWSIANLSLSLVGHLRGGLVAGRRRLQHVLLGNVRIDHRRRRGHEPWRWRSDEAGRYSPPSSPDHCVCVHHAALVPPSITAVVYGAVGNVSIAGLFMAGVVPGLMIGFGLMIYCYFFGRPACASRARRSARWCRRRRRGASLDDPVILLGASHRIFHADGGRRRRRDLIIVVVIPALNRGISRKFPTISAWRADLFAAADHDRCGNAFGWMLAYLRGAAVIADWITSLPATIRVDELLLVLLFTVVGDFIEPVPDHHHLHAAGEYADPGGDINGVHMGVVLIATLPRTDHAALRAGAPDGVEIRRRQFFQGIARGAAIYVVFLVTICFTIYFPKVVLWLPKQVTGNRWAASSRRRTGYICPN